MGVFWRIAALLCSPSLPRFIPGRTRSPGGRVRRGCPNRQRRGELFRQNLCRLRANQGKIKQMGRLVGLVMGNALGSVDEFICRSSSVRYVPQVSLADGRLSRCFACLRPRLQPRARDFCRDSPAYDRLLTAPPAAPATPVKAAPFHRPLTRSARAPLRFARKPIEPPVSRPAGETQSHAPPAPCRSVARTGRSALR